MIALAELDITARHNFLIAGVDSRADAAGWALRQSPQTAKLAFAGGNAGTTRWGENLPFSHTDTGRIVREARDNNYIVFVSSEDQLAAGLVNACQEAGVYAYGPTKEAAQIESSKWFAIQLMQHLRIPHGRTVAFTNEQLAIDHARHINPLEYVWKENGLRGGKGVYLPKTPQESETIVRRIASTINSQNPLLAQERLVGPELTIIGNSDGKRVVAAIPSQDHKRLYDNDEGPNTGGMGAYSPIPDHIASKEDVKKIERTILQPVVTAMDQAGMPFKGALYVGLIKTAEGYKVIEFNGRWGDPEAQVIWRLMKTDLARLILESIAGKQRRRSIEFRNGAAVGVVLASEGYPGTAITGRLLQGVEHVIDPSVIVFQAATRRDAQGNIITGGGRSALVTATGKDHRQARDRVYNAIGPESGKIWLPGGQLRRDIAAQALNAA